MANKLAKLAVGTCARLGGYTKGDAETPDNPSVKKSLCAMLTPYLARKLASDNPAEVGPASGLTWSLSVSIFVYNNYRHCLVY